ncbi:fasciclin domain-containing protein [Nubsella zeaxanthinifaciens]|uniref:fasciclin domain-containing protein n=1 Tax=Nubsella zeaxanthinifaciens TaxID=392412 RepID=UPI003CFF47AE
MKTLNFKFSKLALMVALVGSAFFSSCKKDNDVQENLSIADIVAADDNFSLLETALNHAQLTGTLKGEGNFTVFAPNNAAFAAAGLDTDAKITAMSAETLKQILLYHVLPNRTPASAIPTASNTAVATSANANVFVTKNANGVFVNGATVLTADVNAKNGVVHIINRVLMPASGNIVQAAQANANFSFLVAAITRASQGSTNVAQVLSGTGPFTVFAPTNQAFINAGFTTIASIQAASPATLTNILTYHVIAGRVLSSDLTEGAMPTTVQGGKVTISLTGGAKVKGLGNTTSSNITTTNVITTNGVIHAIDQVLLPGI